MNSLRGHFLLADNGHSTAHAHPASDPPPRCEGVTRLSFADERLKLEVDFSTLEATWFRSGTRSLLLWGVRTGKAKSDPASDLTPLVELLLRHPEEALHRLQGSWVLLFADSASGQFIVATDRAATRAPCYAQCSDRLVFGLSAEDVIRHDARLREVRPQAIYDYLYFHVIPAPGTVYESVHRLQPGEYLHVDGQDLRRGYYWQPAYDESSDNTGLRQSAVHFRRLLEASVVAELNQGKIGAFLSGGTDSSTIAGMLGKVTGAPANTYSIGFDAQGFDEMEYARIAARHFGTAHHEYYITPDDLVASIPLVAAAYDQPFGNSSALPAYYCARLAQADGMTKLLGGDGGDELFGGNTRYAKQKVFDAYSRVPQWLAEGLVEPSLLRHGFTQRIPLVKKARSYVEQAKIPMPTRLQTYNLLARVGEERIFEPNFLAAIDTTALSRQQAAYYDRCKANSLVNRMLHFDWKFTLADNDLPKVVGTCDLAGVGVGFPMLNEELVEFANRLPPAFKLKGLRLRHFFKAALRDFLPNAIIAKKKHGFGLPFGLWLAAHAGLQQLAFGSLESLRTRGIVRQSFFDDVLHARLKQHASFYGELVWTLMMLELWFQAHLPEYRFDR
ncbi:MAG: asparagine synthase [Betaproteobacteria bacterium]|nr:asparagine synthase [Betaproteobacteria bacterium]